MKTVRTDSLEEVEYAKDHMEIVRTRSGGYELAVPTKWNEKLKPFLGKDFDVDIMEEDQAVRVVFTKRKKPARRAHMLG
jgi:hypothetical protein